MAYDTQGIEQAASQSRENQLRFLVNVGTRRWKLILVFTIVAMFAYGGYHVIRFGHAPEVRWSAQTQLKVRKSPFDRVLLQGLGGTSLLRSTPSALTEHISLGDIAKDVAHTLVQDGIVAGNDPTSMSAGDDLAKKAEEVSGGLSLEPLDNDGLVIIRGAGRTPAEAQRTVELAARAFIRRNQEFLVTEKKEAFDIVQKKMEEVRKRLNDAETEEWDFRKEMGFQTYENLEQDMARMFEHLNTIELRRDGITHRLAELEEELKRNQEELPAALGQINDAIVQGLLDELNALLLEQFTMSQDYQPDYPDLQVIQEDIAQKKTEILAAIAQLEGEGDTGNSVWTRRQTLRDEYTTLQIELKSMEIEFNTVEKRLNERISQWPELSVKRTKYQSIVRVVEQLRNEMGQYIARKVDLEDEMRRGVDPVEWDAPVSAASEVSAPSPLTFWVDFGVGGVAGFIVGFMLAVFLEMMDTSIRGVEDITEYIGLEVIGTIPRMQFGRTRGRRKGQGNFVQIKDEGEVDACIVTQHDPKSPISEAYRTLRTNFQFATIQQKPKTVMVTSAVPGEGKTTTAVNMAVTFADSGFRVLLVDTDLRRPHVHHVLKMQRGPGLADVLRQGIDFEPMIRPTRIRNLSIISSGHVPPNPSELIGSERMRKVMQAMASQFDLIVCDAPSVLVVTDPVLLATNVDTVVLVVSANNARRETVLRAKKLMMTAKANVAGVVLNGLEATRRHYYYYYYYYDDSTHRRRRRWINA